MGATIKLDLTSDVTHLVAGNTDSAKYRYVAKLREDVKVLSPSWLEALRDVWMEGDDDMDVAGLEKQYRLPTFYGLRICLTGFDNRTASPRTDSSARMLTRHSGTAEAHPRDCRSEWGRVPWRPH